MQFTPAELPPATTVSMSSPFEFQLPAVAKLEDVDIGKLELLAVFVPVNPDIVTVDPAAI
jgi:hypothetical protein